VFPDFDDSCVLRARPLEQGVARGAVLFRAEDEGFAVDEVPAYLPSGSGEHLYLHVEKRGLSTPAFTKRLQQRFRLDEREIGYAGRKDERGVTRQWISVPARVVEPALADLRDVLRDDVKLLEAKRHNNKLRLGHLRGNRFTVVVTGEFDRAVVDARRAVVDAGVPNLFGAQRFGAENTTLRQAEAFLSRNKPARSRKEEFWISTIQSSLFNAWLADRVDDGTWLVPLDGDVLEKTLTGAPFVCTDPAADLPRVQAREVTVAGPLVGRAMRSAEREAMTRESRSWSSRGVDVGALLSHPALTVGARRAACIWPGDLVTSLEADRLTLRFTLPKGAYASVVLRAFFGPALVDAAFLDGPVT
jgi:tRNA pseudouridine13 synthase